MRQARQNRRYAASTWSRKRVRCSGVVLSISYMPWCVIKHSARGRGVEGESEIDGEGEGKGGAEDASGSKGGEGEAAAEGQSLKPKLFNCNIARRIEHKHAPHTGG